MALLRSTTLSSSEFFDKLKTKEFDFIPYESIGSCDFNLPTRLFSDEISEDNLVEITSYVNGIKLTYYLPVNIGSYASLNTYTINYDAKIISFISKVSYRERLESHSFELKGDIKLYYLVSLEEWKNAIKMAYDMVISCDEEGLYFTYKDVYKGLCGRNNDMGNNVGEGVNKMLKDNRIEKKIFLGGCNSGSHVTISSTKEDKN